MTKSELIAEMNRIDEEIELLKERKRPLRAQLNDILTTERAAKKAEMMAARVPTAREYAQSNGFLVAQEVRDLFLSAGLCCISTHDINKLMEKGVLPFTKYNRTNLRLVSPDNAIRIAKRAKRNRLFRRLISRRCHAAGRPCAVTASL